LTYISLDGVIENPHLWPPSGDDAGESDAIQTELLLGCDAVLMGGAYTRDSPPSGRTTADGWSTS
jgi:hypothetical protein